MQAQRKMTTMRVRSKGTTPRTTRESGRGHFDIQITQSFYLQWISDAKALSAANDFLGLASSLARFRISPSRDY